MHRKTLGLKFNRSMENERRDTYFDARVTVIPDFPQVFCIRHAILTTTKILS